MIGRTTITGVVVAAGVLGAAGGVWAACPPVADPAVSVQVVDPGPRVSSTKSLDQINVMAGSHGLAREGFRVLGMTQIKMASEMKVRYEHRANGGAACVSVSRVDVKFGLKEHYVHVPREYAHGSCQFNFVMRHEMAHVDINRRTMRKYADILKTEMRAALRHAGVAAAASMVEGQNAQTAVVQKALDAVIERFMKERDALHAAIDEPDSQYAARGQCQGW